MPRKSKYTEEEKKAYFDNIRKNDPKRLCDTCNRFAIHWLEDGRQACGPHLNVVKGEVTTKPLGAKETIDLLVHTLRKAMIVLDPKKNKELILEILQVSKAARPEGISGNE